MRLDLARPVHALMAAVAVLLVTWPMTALLEEASYLEPGVVVVLSVGVVGMGLRALRIPAPVIVLGQTVVAVFAVCALYALDTFWYGLPTPTTFATLGELIGEGGEVLRTYAAPAPTTPGVELLVVCLIALLAVSVDGIAVTCLAPTYAGLPLAAGFLASVSNSGRALEPWYFLALALAWLALVSLEGSSLLGAWSTARGERAENRRDVASGSQRASKAARALAVVAACVAVVVPLALPHLPPTFLAQGLARGGEGDGPADGDVSFADTMDLSADLASQSDDPVIRYRTETSSPPVLRITSTDLYDVDSGTWRPTDSEPEGSGTTSLDLPVEDVDEQVLEESTRIDIQVEDSSLRVPQVALPYPLTGAEFPDPVATYDPEADRVVLTDQARAYDATTLELPPSLPEGIGEREETSLHEGGRWLEVPEDARPALDELTEDVLGSTTNDLDRAVLLQQHFRSGAYAYDLQLDPNPEAIDPVVHFLQTRRGYCVQFATGMIMAARSEGIPARMGVGFIPGELQEDGSRVVRASDAHAWPELWITGLGWTRFEPTPGVRTGTPPAYTSRTVTPQEDEQQVGDPEPPQPTAPVAPEQEPPEAGADETGDSGLVDTVLGAVRSALPVAGIVLAVLAPLALLVLLLIGAGRRHREAGLRGATRPLALIEGTWTYLVRSLADLGVAPVEERSPRDMAQAYQDRTGVADRPAAALDRAALVLQQARYAPPDRLTLQDARRMERDVRTVLDAVRAELPWNLRLTSRWFPASGVAGVRERVGALTRRRDREDADDVGFGVPQ